MSSEPNTNSTTQTETTEDPEPIDREDAAIRLWEDYHTVEQSLTEDGYYVWSSAKSASRGFSEQSHIQHIRNGVDFLATLYQTVSEDTPFLTEETLRRACACFVAHDYHKRLEQERGYDEQFDVTLSDAEEFMEASNLSALSDTLDKRELRGVMAAHHSTDDNALHDSVPQSIFDAYHLVLVADSVASNSSISKIRRSIIQERLTSALGHNQYTVHKHELNLDTPAINAVAHNAFANVLNEREEWEVVRQYGDGCLYIAPHTDEPDTDGLIEDVYDEFHDLLANGHIAYSDETIEASGLETENATGRYYDVSHRDIYYQGATDTAVGVMQRAIRDAGNPNDFPKDERKRIENNIAPYIDTDIQTETRHISGLARGVQTLYISFIQFLTDENADEEWKSDPLRAMLKVFELGTEDRIEEVEELREENGSRLKTGRTQWLYKYLIAQYIYDDYYDGRDMTSLKKTFRRLFEANLGRFDGFDNYENAIGVGKVHDELKVVLSRGLSIDGSEFESEQDDALDRLSDYESDECVFCGVETTAKGDGDGFGDGHYLLKSVPEIQMKTDDGVTTLDGDTNLCYGCQLEVATRQSHDSNWANADEDTLFVHYQTDFGYVPLSWRVEETLRHQSLDPSTLEQTPDKHADSVMSDENQPTVWENPSYLDHKNWTNTERGFHPHERFAGCPLPLTESTDADERFDVITSTVINAVYAGVSVHITKYPMMNTDDRGDEIVSFGSDAADELTFYGENIELTDARDSVEEAVTVNHLTDEIGFDGRVSVLNLFAENTLAPASRLFWMAHERGVETDEKHAAAVARMDDEFGRILPQAERMAQSLVSLDYNAADARSLVLRHLSKAVEGDTPTAPAQEANKDDSLSFHDAAAHQYKTEVERACERADIPSVAHDMADTVFNRIDWQN